MAVPTESSFLDKKTASSLTLWSSNPTSICRYAYTCLKWWRYKFIHWRSMVWIIESWQTKMKAKKWTLKWKSLENMSIGSINNKLLLIHTMNTATKNEAVLYINITLRNCQGILSCKEKTSCWKCACFVVVWSLSHVQLFCNPMDCQPPGLSVHGISQATILEGVDISPGDPPNSGIELAFPAWQRLLYRCGIWEAL